MTTWLDVIELALILAFFLALAWINRRWFL